MTTSPVDHERRAAQRFEYQLPVSIKSGGNECPVPGLTQDLSARGAFLYTDASFSVGDILELTLQMPAEITLADSMRVRCKGRVLRVARHEKSNKFGVAVQLEGYEYLAHSDDAGTEGTYARISSLHSQVLDPADQPGSVSAKRSV